MLSLKPQNVVDPRKDLPVNGRIVYYYYFLFFMIFFEGAFATSGVEGVATFNSGNGSIPTGMLILFNMGSIDADIYTSVANIKREVKESDSSNRLDFNDFYMVGIQPVVPQSRILDTGRIRPDFGLSPSEITRVHPHPIHRSFTSA